MPPGTASVYGHGPDNTGVVVAGEIDPDTAVTVGKSVLVKWDQEQFGTTPESISSLRFIGHKK